MSLLQRTTARGLGSRPTHEILRRCDKNNITRLQPRRSVHLGALEPAVTLTAQTLSAIHSTGVPWYLTIPLLAAGVNFTIRLPLRYYAWNLRLRRRELEPLTGAWVSTYTEAQMLSWRDNKPALSKNYTREILRKSEKERRRIWKTWGVQRWKGMMPLLSMVPFVVVSETLRRLAGVGMLETAEGLLSQTSVTSTNLFDTSMASGGCLWFVDLTAADPYMGLPLICSALLGWNTWANMGLSQVKALLTVDGKGSPITKAVQRTLFLMPLMPLIFSHVPAAVVLYWASSFGIGRVNDVIMERLLPEPPETLKVRPTEARPLPYLRSKPLPRRSGVEVKRPEES